MTGRPSSRRAVRATGGRGSARGREDAPLSGDAFRLLLAGATEIPASELSRVVDVAGQVLGAESARVLVADYGLTTLQPLGEYGPTGEEIAIDGTLVGRAFTSGDVVVSSEQLATVWVPLTDERERLGILELVHPAWTDARMTQLEAVVRILVLILISKRRYGDSMLRSRRRQPLSMAAEMQWDLLPPLNVATERVSVSGILEPAYSIGGDSIDIALNPGCVEFSILDAVGHGTSAVSLAAVAVNALRNGRREGIGLEAAYHGASRIIEEQFGDAAFVTGQMGSLALDTGVLTWLNAGHPLPLLVRDRSYVGELHCRPSMPIGLGGDVAEIAEVTLQPEDRVLFHTDGVTEARSATGERFGIPRLADLLVRATLDGTFPAETVRRLSILVVDHNGAGLTDDATLLMIDYHGPKATRIA